MQTAQSELLEPGRPVLRDLGPSDEAGTDAQLTSATPVADGGAPAALAIAVCPTATPEAAPLAVVAPQSAAFDPAAFLDELDDLEIELSTALRMGLKRAMDIAVATAALVLVLPVFALIAALIKLTDGGPIFFSQRRVGLRGQMFRMLKFRSMVVDAERLRPRLEVRNESTGPVFKMRLDPRITPIGKFIRKYSLDELPQLINVLRGEMSLVGTRPSLPREVARYEPWQYRRFAVRPGLTCFWQVCRSRYQISFDDWMRLDLKYVDAWSLRLDFRLILRTFAVVFGGTGQ